MPSKSETTIALALMMVSTMGPTSASGADALDKMEMVFEGDYSRSTIETYIKAGLEEYGLPNTEENRNKLGSVLVRMRQESRVPEMEILRCMVGADVGGMGVSAPEAAAICATLLAD